MSPKSFSISFSTLEPNSSGSRSTLSPDRFDHLPKAPKSGPTPTPTLQHASHTHNAPTPHGTPTLPTLLDAHVIRKPADPLLHHSLELLLGWRPLSSYPILPNLHFLPLDRVSQSLTAYATLSMGRATARQSPTAPRSFHTVTRTAAPLLRIRSASASSSRNSARPDRDHRSQSTRSTSTCTHVPNFGMQRNQRARHTREPNSEHANRIRHTSEPNSEHAQTEFGRCVGRIRSMYGSKSDHVEQS